jgi:segregation and condensation protein A
MSELAQPTETAELPLVHLPALARVRGEPVTEMPTDLYIPPDALEVFLETFEGPLDLLLYLIRKANVDILDIPMARVTQQYLEYVEAMRTKNLELAAEYLVMAAMLMEIKSRMLLPRPAAGQAEDPVDPRAELVRRLLEYEQMKAAARELDALPQRDRDFVSVHVWVEESLTRRLPEVSAQDLVQAWRELLRDARVRGHHHISREQLSVREYMIIILRTLRDRGFCEFRELFSIDQGVPMLVVNFLAMLELAREGLVQVTQAQPFAPIYVKLNDADDDRR